MKQEFEFIKGQRFISQTEQELGLGSVAETNHRMVKIVFNAANESRIYAKDNAPISRIVFESGDKIAARAGWHLSIESVQELNGLTIYQGVDGDGKDVLLPETELADNIKLDRPTERLLSGHLDSNKWYNLRQLASLKQKELAHNPLYGLLGCRTSLLKHQLYIAHTVGKRFAPRVLLADEVGLGKTIEAGLIIHQQLLKNRAKRVLIIMPESLTHQWMVEMLRRFNLHFSVYDEQQCLSIEESSSYATPFESSQLAIVPLQFLLSHPARAKQVLATPWDLMVVDEAHHLQWSEQTASAEYQLIEKLANNINGVLLLTATPEQLGKESHFARLRLLDPNRFNSFEKFIAQEHNYQSIVNAIDILRSDKTMTKTALKNTSQMFTDAKQIQQIHSLFAESLDKTEEFAIKQGLIEQLLDQHGTGRLLFRNTRSAIKGFPNRRLHKYALENCYEDATTHEIAMQLTPERINAFENWTKFDSRMLWLRDKIINLNYKKILLIAANKQTVLDIKISLREKLGVHSAVFHEDLSLIERDKAAAWFADEDQGPQIMLCSEIGSEGRNFQFAQHIILFDLPFNPDLVEQRIGRLDRIGQKNTIHIHVPYFQGTASEKLFTWYHKGLNIFEKTCPAGYSLYKQQYAELITMIGKETSAEDFSAFIVKTAELVRLANQKFQQGRDRLLEYNSCRPFIAEQLLQQAELQDDSSCQRFMHRMFDRYGVDYGELRNNVELIKQGDAQQVHFPKLIEEGMSITFDRETALANETLHYITWEHPMVVAAMDMIAGAEKGNATLVSLANTGLPPSTIIIETLFNLQAPADRNLQISRYFPTEPIRLVADETLKNRSKALDFQFIHNNHSSVPLNIALQVVKMKQKEIKNTIEIIEKTIAKMLPEQIQQAQTLATTELDVEIARLQNLNKINASIRIEEIQHLEQQKTATLQALSQAQIQMNAIRVLVCL